MADEDLNPSESIFDDNDQDQVVDQTPSADSENLDTAYSQNETFTPVDSTDYGEDEDGLPSFRKKQTLEDHNQSDQTTGILRKKKKKRHLSPDADVRRSHDLEQEEDQDIPMTPAESRKARANALIEEALKAGKKKTQRRKRAGEDDLDVLADEEVAALRREMVLAADDDEEANRLKKPAIAKLRLLPKVVATLQKNHLQQSILDNNLLEGVKRWLEPLPDKSLPALNIQHQFFQILQKMTIDTISLKMSGLGKVVVFYSMCPRVEPSIKRIAENLIELWSRPVLKRSSSYRDRHIVAAEWNPERSTNQLGLTPSQIVDNGRRNVNIPQAITAGFRVAPRSTAGQKTDTSHDARLANHQKLNRFKSRLKEAKR